jgi:hypothetical protein
MRIRCAGVVLSAVGLLLTFTGSVAAQDTNFATGPQYLAIQGSPLFARPISTPSLSLETQMEQPSEHVAIAESPVEATAPPAEAQADRAPRVDFFTFYYASPLAGNFGEAISGQELEPAAERQGPEKTFDVGVSQVMDARSIRLLGSGATLADQSAQQKSRKPTPSHTYTNEDIERLRQGN